MKYWERKKPLKKVWVLEAYGGAMNEKRGVPPRVHILHPTKIDAADAAITLCGKTPFGREYALYTSVLKKALELNTDSVIDEMTQLPINRSKLITCKACRGAANKIVKERENQVLRAYLKKKRERLAHRGSKRTKQLRQARQVKEDVLGLGY